MAKTSMFVKLTAQPGRRDELVAALQTMDAAVAGEEGTEIYALNLDTTDENTIWMYELYTSDDALAVHSGSEAMVALMGELAGLLGDAPMLLPTVPVSGKGTGL